MRTLLLVCALSLCACTELDTYVTDNPESVDQAATAVKAIGTVAAPATGGLSAIIAGLVAAALPTLVAVNRSLAANKNKKKADAGMQAMRNVHAVITGDPVMAEKMNTPEMRAKMYEMDHRTDGVREFVAEATK